MSATNSSLNLCSICSLSSYDGNLVVFENNLTFQALDLLSDETPIKLKCDHIFHASCLHFWIEIFIERINSAYCPKCPLNVDPFLESQSDQNFSSSPDFPDFTNWSGQEIDVQSNSEHSSSPQLTEQVYPFSVEQEQQVPLSPGFPGYGFFDEYTDLLTIFCEEQEPDLPGFLSDEYGMMLPFSSDLPSSPNFDDFLDILPE